MSALENLNPTHLVPPRAHRTLLVRSRLARRLARSGGSRLIWVCAPAGYGKTSLLLQWYATLTEDGESAAWLRLPDRKLGPEDFLRSITASLEQAKLAVPDTRPPRIATIADLLTSLGRPMTFFFDDFDLEEARTGQLFAELIESLPPRCRFVVASRWKRAVPLARLRAWGDFDEIGVSDLAFDAEEAEAFLRQATGSAVDATEARLLNERLRGWATGLQLAVAGHTSGNLADIAITGSRGYIRDYFQEELLQAVTEPLRGFMRDISLFPVLSTELCDIATERKDSRDRLADLAEVGCFLTIVDANRDLYAFHPLFREFLVDALTQADPEHALAVARRGGAHLEEAGHIAEALEAAITTQDWLRAAEILNRACPDLTYHGRVHQVAGLLHKLPWSSIQQSPRVLLTMAWAMSTQHQFAAAQDLLRLASDYLATRHDETEEVDRERIGYLLDHGAMMIAQFTDDQAEAERKCQQLLSRSVDIDPYVVGSVESSLLYAQREQFNLRNLPRLSTVARERFREAGTEFGVVWHQSIVGPTLCMAGDTVGALAALRESFASARTFAKNDEWLPAGPACLLAEVHFERNELQEARELMEEFRPRLKHGFVDHMIAGHVTWARLLAAQGQLDEASDHLAQTVSFARNRGIRRLRDVAVGEWIKALLARGRVGEALQIARTEGLDLDPQLLAPVTGVTTAVEARAITWARIAKATGRNGHAMQLARRWAALTTERGAVRSAIRWDILIGQLLFMDGDVSAARRRLRKAASNAAPGLFLRVFLDEGESALQLLSGSDQDHAPATTTDYFIRRILDLSGRSATPKRSLPETEETPAITPLTPREIDVAAWVGAGLSNREIGDRLAMTEGSVKWHLQQIYDKIGVRRRASAIQRLRELGLLP